MAASGGYEWPPAAMTSRPGGRHHGVNSGSYHGATGNDPVLPLAHSATSAVAARRQARLPVRLSQTRLTRGFGTV